MIRKNDDDNNPISQIIKHRCRIEGIFYYIQIFILNDKLIFSIKRNIKDIDFREFKTSYSLEDLQTNYNNFYYFDTLYDIFLEISKTIQENKFTIKKLNDSKISLILDLLLNGKTKEITINLRQCREFNYLFKDKNDKESPIAKKNIGLKNAKELNSIIRNLNYRVSALESSQNHLNTEFGLTGVVSRKIGDKNSNLNSLGTVSGLLQKLNELEEANNIKDKKIKYLEQEINYLNTRYLREKFNKAMQKGDNKFIKKSENISKISSENYNYNNFDSSSINANSRNNMTNKDQSKIQDKEKHYRPFKSVEAEKKNYKRPLPDKNRKLSQNNKKNEKKNNNDYIYIDDNNINSHKKSNSIDRSSISSGVNNSFKNKIKSKEENNQNKNKILSPKVEKFINKPKNKETKEIKNENKKKTPEIDNSSETSLNELRIVSKEDLSKYVDSKVIFTKEELKLLKNKISQGNKHLHIFFDLLHRATEKGQDEKIIKRILEEYTETLTLFYTHENARFGVYIQKELAISLLRGYYNKEVPGSSFLVGLNNCVIFDAQPNKVATDNSREVLCYGRTFYLSENGSNWMIYTPKNKFLGIKLKIAEENNIFQNLVIEKFIGPNYEYHLKEVEIFEVVREESD